jgi:hypothetical protein
VEGGGGGGCAYDGIYEFPVRNNITGATYRVTLAFCSGDTGVRVTVTRLGYNLPIPQADIAKTLGPYVVYGTQDAWEGLSRLLNVAQNTGVSPVEIYEDLKKAFERANAFDKQYGGGSRASKWDSVRPVKREMDVFMFTKSESKAGNATEGATWFAIPGVFLGTSAGGWDMFADYLKTVWINGTRSADISSDVSLVPHITDIGNMTRWEKK